MNGDKRTLADTRPARIRRSAKAHWLLSGVTRRQAELHRELATLLEKEAEAHVVLDRWARDGASRLEEEGTGDVMLRWGKEHLKQVALAQQEVAAHRDLARRSDARTLWHKTVAVLLLRAAMEGRNGQKDVMLDKIDLEPPGMTNPESRDSGHPDAEKKI